MSRNFVEVQEELYRIFNNDPVTIDDLLEFYEFLEADKLKIYENT